MPFNFNVLYMHCPKCSCEESKVLETRVSKSMGSIRRRRTCSECGYRFSTIEEVLKEDTYVVKRDGRREDFDKAKIISGIRKATEKRALDAEQMELIVADMLRTFESEYDYEIPSKAIGEAVMVRLKSIDQISYVRYASIYKDFRDIGEFTEEVARLNENKTKKKV